MWRRVLHPPANMRLLELGWGNNVRERAIRGRIACDHSPADTMDMPCGGTEVTWPMQLGREGEKANQRGLRKGGEGGGKL